MGWGLAGVARPRPAQRLTTWKRAARGRDAASPPRRATRGSDAAQAPGPPPPGDRRASPRHPAPPAACPPPILWPPCSAVGQLGSADRKLNTSTPAAVQTGTAAASLVLFTMAIAGRAWLWRDFAGYCRRRTPFAVFNRCARSVYMLVMFVQVSWVERAPSREDGAQQASAGSNEGGCRGSVRDQP
jgi:hypothetical protein